MYAFNISKTLFSTIVLDTVFVTVRLKCFCDDGTTSFAAHRTRTVFELKCVLNPVNGQSQSF